MAQVPTQLILCFLTNSLSSTTSPLLRLPPELRNKIYFYVFSSHRISVLSYQHRSRCYAALADTDLIYDDLGLSTFKRLVAPTQVCRQMYAESRLLPYKYNTYDIKLVYNFTSWMCRLDKGLQAAVEGALTESQSKYVQEIRDGHGW